MKVPVSGTSYGRNRRLKKKNISPHLRNFLDNTSLHGLKYICDSNRHLIERFFWGIVLISFIISLFGIYRMKMSKWQRAPITLEVASTPVHVSTLPKPAFTICQLQPGKKYEWKLSKNNSRVLKSNTFITEFAIDFLATSEKGSIIPDSELKRQVNYMFGALRAKNETFCFVTHTDRGICQSCNIFPPSKIYRKNRVRGFFRGSWRFLDLSCDIHFTNHCYQSNNDTINGFPSIEIVGSSDESENHNRKESYPTLVEDTRIQIKLFNLYGQIPLYSSMFEPIFAIHSPWDLPSPFMRWHHLKGRSTVINIEPEQILQYPSDASDFLYSIPFSNQCYNTIEKNLDYFQYYTLQNCLIECSTKKALEKCGCVLFFMPHNETTYICSDWNSPCAFNESIKAHYASNDENNVYSCDCLPTCNSTEYKVMSIDSDYPETDIEREESNMLIVFRDDFFYPKIRTLPYNKYNIIDSTVAYLDIFLGVTLLSIAEIFYYSSRYIIDYFRSRIKRQPVAIVDILSDNIEQEY